MSRKKGTTGKSTNRSPQAGNAWGLTNKENLADLQNWFLPDDSIFAKLRFHGNTSWIPRGLFWLAVCWSWSSSRNLTDAFAEAMECSRKIAGSSALSTYQGFMGAMV